MYRSFYISSSTDDGTIWDIGSKNEDESTIILDVSEDDYALCNTTSFKQPAVLSSLHIPSAICGTSDETLLVPLTKPYTIVEKAIISTFTVHHENTKNGNKSRA